MRSVPQALLWETFTRGRWSLTLLFLVSLAIPSLMYQFFAGMSVDMNSREMVVIQFTCVLITTFMLASSLIAVQGPLSRLYSLPISTNAIVMLHLLSGALIVALETASLACFMNGMFRANWPVVGPALFAASAFSALHVFVCGVNQLNLSGCVMGSIPGGFLVLWYHARYGSFLSPPKYLWNEITVWESLTLLFIIGVCFAIANFATSRARCGERLPSLGIWRWISQRFEAYERSVANGKPFRSASQAQFWFEWQTKGIGLILAFSLLVSVVLVGGFCAWYFYSIGLETLFPVVLWLGAFLPFLALPSGVFLGLDFDSNPSDQKDRKLSDSLEGLQFESGIGSFAGSRPLTNWDLAVAIMKTAAWSSFLSWLVWFALFTGVMVSFWMTKQSPTAWLPEDTGWLFLPITILGPWLVQSNCAMLGTSGRGVSILGWLVGIAVGYCLFLGGILYVSDALFVVRVHTVCTSIVAVIMAGFGIFATAMAHRKGYVSTKTVLKLVFSSCALLVGATLLLPSHSHFIAYPLILGCVTLIVTPFATLPLSISWNRHR